MSSKILSVQDSKSWQRPTKRGSRQEEPPVQEFRGLPNRVIITIVLSLVCFGLMAVYSSSANEALQTFQDSTVYLRKQAIAALVGCFLMFYMSRQDYRKLRKYAWPLALASLFLLALTLVPHLSVTAKGSSRWLALGPLQFQPSEMAKVSCIILLASGLSKYFWWHRQVLWRVGITVAIAFIVMKQPDLGTGLMILGAMLALLFCSGANFLLMGSSLVGGAFAVWHHVKSTPYQMARIQSWLNPYNSPQKDGWNIIQAQLAIGSGGLWGVGFGRSLQKLYYLPVQHADFILAVIAEEFGFLGCMVLLGMFTLLAYHGFRTALESRTLFGRFLAIGITSSIALQAMVNVMVTSGVLPVTGLTLPFISYGGTSLVMTLGMVGILLSISRDRGQLSEDDEFDYPEAQAPY